MTCDKTSHTPLSFVEAERRVMITVGLVRIAWNATVALAPGSLHRIGGIEFPGPDGGMWARAFGIRGTLIGVGALHPDDAVRRATRQAGIAMDSLDACAVAIAGRNGLPAKATAIGVTMASSAAAFAAFGPGILHRRSLTRSRFTE